jgi:nucleotide-binding universal stress UspA family protein
MASKERTMRVLLATDGSDDARTATEWLSAFPLAPSTKALVVTVALPPPSALDIPTVREFKHEMAEAARVVAESARVVLARRWDAEAVVLEGDPRETIAATANAWSADIVVVGARGLGTFKRFLLGSVSSAIARHVHCPVLVVKGRPASLRTALVAIDGSPDSMAAARFLAALPLERTLTVRLLTAIEGPQYPSAIPGILAKTLHAALDELVREQAAAAEKILARVGSDFVGRAAVIRRDVVVGPAADEIIQAAADAGVDLVVVGARGLGPIGKLLLGSVSEKVLHHVDCPVLIVKGREGIP